jgi:hypothetical protein
LPSYSHPQSCCVRYHYNPPRDRIQHHDQETTNDSANIPRRLQALRRDVQQRRHEQPPENLHRARCKLRHGPQRPGDQSPLRLVIQDRYAGDYWLHVERPTSSPLGPLDNYLRAIWLECCGHLSEFFFNETRYISYEDDDDLTFGPFALPPRKSMFETTLASVLPVGAGFRYNYDFDSTTDLEGRVVAEREGKPSGHAPIRLLARNLPPVIPCSECGEQALWICPHCVWDGTGLLCQDCAEDHGCEWGNYEELMPVVNSPRTGVCAYAGGPLT